MLAENLKQMSAQAALEYIRPRQIIGIGTGSTVEYFIQALAESEIEIEATVASSEKSKESLSGKNIAVVDLNAVERIDVYVDGADEIDPQLRLIKGGGGALTREKILAHVSDQFVCIADESKLVTKLGAFPLPIEVIPMARNMVARELVRMQATPSVREAYITDNGNQIIDVGGLDMSNPLELEERLSQIPGVVSVGLFVRRPADVVLLGRPDKVETLTRAD